MDIRFSGTLLFATKAKLKAALGAYDGRRYLEFMPMDAWSVDGKSMSIDGPCDAPADCVDHLHEAFLAATKDAVAGHIDIEGQGEGLRRVYAGGYETRWNHAQLQVGTATLPEDGIEVAQTCTSGEIEAVAYYHRMASRVRPLREARKYNDLRRTSVVLRAVGDKDERARLFGPVERCTALFFANDGAWLVAAAADEYIYVWETKNGALLKKKKAHKRFVSAACLDGGDTIWSAGEDDRLKQWALPKLTLIGEAPIPFVPTAMAPKGDGSVVIERTSYNGTVQRAECGLGGADSGKALDVAAFLKAIAKEKLPKVKEYLASDARYGSLGAADGNLSPLMVAVTRKKAVELCTLLLDAGARPVAEGEVMKATKTSPLHAAIRHAKYKSLVDLLVAHGADIQETDFEGCTPIAHARDEKAVGFLLSKGARPNAVDLKVRWAEDDIRKLLLDADLDLETREGMWAVSGMEEPGRTALVKLGAPVSWPDEEHEGFSLFGPCHQAAMDGDDAFLVAAFRAGADTDQRCYSGVFAGDALLPPGSTLLDIAEACAHKKCAAAITKGGGARGERTAYAVMSDGEITDEASLRAAFLELGVSAAEADEKISLLRGCDIELMRFDDEASGASAAKKLAAGVPCALA